MLTVATKLFKPENRKHGNSRALGDRYVCKYYSRYITSKTG